MIEMQYNFPLLPTQGPQWQQRLADAVAALSPVNSDELRPTFRQHREDHKATAARWLHSDPACTWITCGGHHGALVSLLAAGLPGKTIAVEAVTYTGILEQSQMLRSPLAALGCVASLARRHDIVQVARDFDLILIEDDAYGYMEPAAPPSYAMLAPERTFYVRGLSKSYAPATRTGFLVAPTRFAASIENVIKHTATGTSLPNNAAELSLIADGSLEELIHQKLLEGARRNKDARAILGPAAAPGVPSAWHLWVWLPKGLDAPTAQRLCEERGSLVSGGQSFTVPGTPIAEGLRLALGGELDPARTLEGIHIVAEVLGSPR